MQKLKIKLILLATSIVLLTVLLNFSAALVILSMIFVHEYCHLLAGRHLGIADSGMFFLPGIGAVATFSESFKSSGNVAFIALAGPLAGMMVGGLWYGAGYMLDSGFCYAAAALVGAINLINLFPIFPLDGGRIWFSLLHNQHHLFGKMSLGIIATVMLVLSVLAVIYYGVWVLLIVVFFGSAELFSSKTKEMVPLNFKKRFLVLCSYVFLIFIGAQLLGDVTNEDILKYMTSDGEEQPATEEIESN